MKSSTRRMSRTVLALAATTLVATAAAQESPDEDAKDRSGGRMMDRDRGDMMMQHMDRDGDGAISLQEFQARGEQRFEQMDADGDGRVTAQEIEAARQRMGQRMRHHRQMRMEPGDARGMGPHHGDGMGEGMGEGMHHRHGAHHDGEAAAGREQRRARRFARLDADGDGRITEAEFKQHHAERFQALDADDDGVITAEEMSARQGMRDSRSK